MRRLLIVALALVACTGCGLTTGYMPSNFAQAIEAAGKDQATHCLVASYGPAQLMFARTNIQNGDVACNSQGLNMKSQGAQVGVPITVIPQISVGAPVGK